jgi:hypothetical protein
MTAALYRPSRQLRHAAGHLMHLEDGNNLYFVETLGASSGDLLCVRLTGNPTSRLVIITGGGHCPRTTKTLVPSGLETAPSITVRWCDNSQQDVKGWRESGVTRRSLGGRLLESLGAFGLLDT